MTILETFIKLRDDLKLWVTNNLNEKADINQTLPLSGGTMTGAINTSGIVLTKNIDYGDTLPEQAVEGTLFFVKAQKAE